MENPAKISPLASAFGKLRLEPDRNNTCKNLHLLPILCLFAIWAEILPRTASLFRISPVHIQYGVSHRGRCRRRHSRFPGTSPFTLPAQAKPRTDCHVQGRAGLVALRRYRGGVNALGRPFYKGGFEPRMNRREAALILELSYVVLKILSSKIFPYVLDFCGLSDMGWYSGTICADCCVRTGSER